MSTDARGPIATLLIETDINLRNSMKGLTDLRKSLQSATKDVETLEQKMRTILQQATAPMKEIKVTPKIDTAGISGFQTEIKKMKTDLASLMTEILNYQKTADKVLTDRPLTREVGGFGVIVPDVKKGIDIDGIRKELEKTFDAIPLGTIASDLKLPDYSKTLPVFDTHPLAVYNTKLQDLQATARAAQKIMEDLAEEQLRVLRDREVSRTVETPQAQVLPPMGIRSVSQVLDVVAMKEAGDLIDEYKTSLSGLRDALPDDLRVKRPIIDFNELDASSKPFLSTIKSMNILMKQPGEKMEAGLQKAVLTLMKATQEMKVIAKGNLQIPAVQQQLQSLALSWRYLIQGMEKIPGGTDALRRAIGKFEDDRKRGIEATNELSRREAMYMRWIGRDIMRIGYMIGSIGDQFLKVFSNAAKSSFYLEGALEDIAFAFEDIFSVVGDIMAPVFEVIADIANAIADFVYEFPPVAIFGVIAIGIGLFLKLISILATAAGSLMLFQFGLVDVMKRMDMVKGANAGVMDSIVALAKGLAEGQFVTKETAEGIQHMADKQKALDQQVALTTGSQKKWVGTLKKGVGVIGRLGLGLFAGYLMSGIFSSGLIDMSGIMDMLIDTFEPVLLVIQDFIDGIVDLADSIPGGDIVKGLIGGLLLLLAVPPQILSTFYKFGKGFVKAIAGMVQGALQWLWKLVTGQAKVMKNIEGMWAELRFRTTERWTSIKEAIGTAWDTIRGKTREAVGFLRGKFDIIKAGLIRIGGAFKGLIGQAGSALGGIVSGIAQAVPQIVKGFGAMIMGALGFFKAQVLTLVAMGPAGWAILAGAIATAAVVIYGAYQLMNQGAEQLHNSVGELPSWGLVKSFEDLNEVMGQVKPTTALDVAGQVSEDVPGATRNLSINRNTSTPVIYIYQTNTVRSDSDLATITNETSRIISERLEGL
jgi:hypothetical protein